MGDMKNEWVNVCKARIMGAGKWERPYVLGIIIITISYYWTFKEVLRVEAKWASKKES